MSCPCGGCARHRVPRNERPCRRVRLVAKAVRPKTPAGGRIPARLLLHPLKPCLLHVPASHSRPITSKREELSHNQRNLLIFIGCSREYFTCCPKKAPCPRLLRLPAGDFVHPLLHIG